MRVATEEFFSYAVLLNWSWSWSWSYTFGLGLGLNILVIFPSLMLTTNNVGSWCATVHQVWWSRSMKRPIHSAQRA